MRRAMAEPLVEAVLANQRRGQQAADIGRRLLASCDEVEAAIDEVRRSPPATHYWSLTAWKQREPVSRTDSPQPSMTRRAGG